jgi:hypothetical protein
MSHSLEISDPFPNMGPFPIEDVFGMKVVAVMLTQSLDTGKHAATIQFSTMRKMRGVFLNTYQFSAQGYSSSAVMAKDTYVDIMPHLWHFL